MSLRLRVALLTALGVALIEIAIVASIYAFMSQRLYAQVEDELRATAATLAPVVSATGDLPRPGQDPERVPYIRRALTADGRVISTRGAAEPLPITLEALRVARGELRSSLETVRAAGEPFSILTVAASDGRAVQVARSVAGVEALLQQLLVGAAVLGAAGVAAALAAGVAVAAGAHLEQLVGQLERARSAQRQLVADASHELRAPLATLRANVELLSLGADAPTGDRDALLSDTLAGIEDLTALVGQLIDLAREDERVLVRAPLRLDDLVHEEVDRIERRYPNVGFRAQLEATEIVGDREALARAVANLLDNAGKWTPAGRSVHVGLHDGTLSVRDEGPGIDAADLPHVFERFYRGSRSAAVPGSGLGLAIVARVVAAHGGRVDARSGPDRGATFTVTLATASS